MGTVTRVVIGSLTAASLTAAPLTAATPDPTRCSPMPKIASATYADASARYCGDAEHHTHELGIRSGALTLSSSSSAAVFAA